MWRLPKSGNGAIPEANAEMALRMTPHLVRESCRGRLITRSDDGYFKTLLWEGFRPHDEFTSGESSFARIVGDVAAEMIELFRGSDKVIETVLLPKAS